MCLYNAFTAYGCGSAIMPGISFVVEPRREPALLPGREEDFVDGGVDADRCDGMLSDAPDAPPGLAFAPLAPGAANFLPGVAAAVVAMTTFSSAVWA